MKAEFIESLPPSAKEYDEKNMYRDGKLSLEFLKVSKVISKIDVTLIISQACIDSIRMDPSLKSQTAAKNFIARTCAKLVQSPFNTLLEDLHLMK